MEEKYIIPWKVYLRLDPQEAETTGKIDYFGNHTYIIYFDGEKKECTSSYITFNVNETMSIKDIKEKIKGTKGIKSMDLKIL